MVTNHRIILGRVQQIKPIKINNSSYDLHYLVMILCLPALALHLQKHTQVFLPWSKHVYICLSYPSHFIDNYTSLTKEASNLTRWDKKSRSNYTFIGNLTCFILKHKYSINSL